MFCSNCGKEIEAGAAFCPHCGASTSTESHTVNGETVSTTNQSLEKAKDISKNYFGFVMDHLKAPLRHGFSVNKTQWINGLITLIIFLLFSGLSTYLFTRSVVRAYDIFGLSKTSFLDSMILPMLYMAITLAIIMAVIFVVAKLMKSNVSYQDVVARFGTLMLLPTVLMILTFVFTLLKLGTLVAFASAGYGLTWICAIVLTVYSYGKEDNGGLDAYYGILITFLALTIALYLFGETLLRSLIRF